MPGAAFRRIKDISERTRAENSASDGTGRPVRTEEAGAHSRGAQAAGTAEACGSTDGTGIADERAFPGQHGAKSAEFVGPGGAGGEAKETFGSRAVELASSS